MKEQYSVWAKKALKQAEKRRHGRPYAYRSGSDRGKAVPAY